MESSATVINRDTLAKIRDKQMDRKDFLKYSGVILLSAVGLNSVMNAIKTIDTPPVSQAKMGRGFGGGKYGV